LLTLQFAKDKYDSLSQELDQLKNVELHSMKELIISQSTINENAQKIQEISASSPSYLKRIDTLEQEIKKLKTD